MEAQPKSMSTLDKVKRLLALAQSNNPHEAAAAAAEAQRLMMKHGIEMAELNAPQSVDRLIVDTGNMNVWYRVLAKHVAGATFCTIYALSGAGPGKSTGQVAICGYKDDVAVASVLLAWLAQEVNRLCDLEWAPLRSSGLSANAWKKSFRLGAVHTIGQRLAMENQKQRAILAETTAPTSNWNTSSCALTRLDTYSNDAALAVKKFLSAEGTRLSSSRAAGPKHGDAFAQGREAGHRVGLTPPKRALTGAM